MKGNKTARPLAGRVALVTGATRAAGIGAAICRRLAAEGADIAAGVWRPYDHGRPYDVSDDEPDRLIESLRAEGVRAEAMEIDLSLPDGPQMLLDRTIALLGKPSILINNAAVSTDSTFDTIDAETLDAHYRVNARASVLLTCLIARGLTSKDGGRIVNLTSGQSLGPMPGELAYALTKGTVETLTRTLCHELGLLGATINTVNPGPTDTGWISDQVRQTLLRHFPAARIGMPEDAARLVAFLVSEEAAWITGQVIHSEGGFIR